MSNRKIFGKMKNDRPRLDVSKSGEILPIGSNIVMGRK